VSLSATLQRNENNFNKKYWWFPTLLMSRNYGSADLGYLLGLEYFYFRG